MKVYNKTVIDWLLGQQQFCLTLERICCPHPADSGNRSVLASNKIAVVLEPSQYLYNVACYAQWEPDLEINSILLTRLILF